MSAAQFITVVAVSAVVSITIFALYSVLAAVNDLIRDAFSDRED